MGIEIWLSRNSRDVVNKSNLLLIFVSFILTDYVWMHVFFILDSCSNFQINLSSTTREATAGLVGSPNRHTFETAQRRIQALMEKDSYPRFLQSDIYQELLGDQKAHFKFNFTWSILTSSDQGNLKIKSLLSLKAELVSGVFMQNFKAYGSPVVSFSFLGSPLFFHYLYMDIYTWQRCI